MAAVRVRPAATFKPDQPAVAETSQVTSGTVSPSLGRPIMLAMIESEVIRESGNTALKAELGR